MGLHLPQKHTGSYHYQIESALDSGRSYLPLAVSQTKNPQNCVSVPEGCQIDFGILDNQHQTAKQSDQCS